MIRSEEGNGELAELMRIVAHYHRGLNNHSYELAARTFFTMANCNGGSKWRGVTTLKAMGETSEDPVTKRMVNDIVGFYTDPNYVLVQKRVGA